MSRLIIKRAAGLHLGANNLGSVPEGAFKKLDNCVMQAADTVEPRRGFELVGVDGPVGEINALTFFGGKVLAHHTDGLGAQRLGYDSGAGWVDFTGAFDTPDADTRFSRPRFAYAQRRLYMTTKYGIKRTDSLTTEPERAGLQRPDVNWNRSFLVADAAGPIATDTAVAYRAMLVRKDANGLEIQGPPSGRTVLRNPAGQVVVTGNAVRVSNVVTVTTPLPHGLRSGGSITVPIGGDAPPNFLAGTFTITLVTSPTSFKYAQTGPDETSLAGLTYETGQSRADLQVALPPEARAGDILRVFRSHATPTAADEPSDDLYLTQEFILAAGDITAGYATVSDMTPSGILGTAALGYFSSSSEGIISSNERPPYGRELCTFDDRLFVANLNEPQRLFLRLVATGGTVGLDDGDEIVLAKAGGVGAFTMKGFVGTTGGPPGSGYFVIFRDGEVFDDNEKTAQSFVNAVNEHASNNWLLATYVSAFDDLPGLILLELIESQYASHEMTFSVLSADHPQAWVPAIGPSVGITSAGERRKARIRWSKLGLPEAFPLGNVLDAADKQENAVDAGDADEEILRLMPLGDRLYVLKEHSLWVLSGSSPYRCDQLGGPITFIGPDAAAILGGRIFAFTSLGVVAISESGIELVGMPIEEATRSFTGSMLQHVKEQAFGCGDEGGGRYYLGLPAEGSEDDESRPTQAYVWNAVAGGWSRWPKAMHCAAVSPYDSKLYIAGIYNEENRVAKERKSLTRADYKDEFEDGIPCVAQWQTQHMGAPELLKQLAVVKLLFRKFETEAATVVVESEKSVGGVSQVISRRGYEMETPFAGSSLPYNARVLPPREKGTGCYFDISFVISEAEAAWKLQGLHLDFELLSEKEPR